MLRAAGARRCSPPQTGPKSSLARALPAESGVPLSKRSGPDLAREVAVRCGITVSASTIRRWLARDALRPWQHRSWIPVRDPQFAAKATPVLVCTPGSGTAGRWARTTT